MASDVVNEERLIGKLTWRLMPLIFLLYVVAIMDRVNVGVAALTMNEDLGITATVFGTISGIFFIGYFIFEIPSNVILYRVGARVWIARIMITWGIVTMFQGLARDATDITILRFLLGAAEAGFSPGIMIYLTFWFPIKGRARAMSLYVSGLAVANVIGTPISGWMLDNVHWFGLASWRWLFMLEAVPAVILGIVVLFVLIDRPQQAKWLTDDEKRWLAAKLASEHEARLKVMGISKWGALKSGWLWYLSLVYFGFVIGLYALLFWMPQIVKALSSVLTNSQIGLIVTIPYICAVVAMILVANHSDKVMERRFHLGVPLAATALAVIAMPATGNMVLSIVLLTIATMGIYSYLGTFWALPTTMLGEETAVVGIALINSVGNLGGFVGPFLIGFLIDRTHSAAAGMYVLGAILLMSTILTVLLPKRFEAAAGSAPTEVPALGVEG